MQRMYQTYQWKLASLLWALIMFVTGCIHFRAGDSYEVLEQAGSVCEFHAIEVEMVNFELDALHESGEQLIKTLRASNCFDQLLMIGSSQRLQNQAIVSEAKPARQLKLRIIFEEFPHGKHPTQYMEEAPGGFSIRQLTQMALMRSAGLLPVYHKIERRISFEVWQGNRLRNQYVYISRFHEVFGLAGILLYPFTDTGNLNQDIHKITQRFLMDARQDSYLSQNSQEIPHARH